jgi:predicted ArsR family transcriptional regulator
LTNRPTPPSQKGKRMIKINAITQAHLIKLLLEGTYTCQELANETGLHYVTVLQYTRELHRAGAAHISGWEKDPRGRDLAKIYKLGEGNDKRRHRKSDAEKQVAYRAKKKQIKLMEMLTSCSAPSVEREPTPLKLEPQLVA